MSAIGDDAVKVYETVQCAERDSDDKLVDVLKNFEEHCNHRQNTKYEIYRFQCMNQEAGETGSRYPTELRYAVENYDFANIKTSQILKAGETRRSGERLLPEKNTITERAYEMVQAAEATAEQTHVMSRE